MAHRSLAVAASSSVANYKAKEWEHLCKALARIDIATEPLPNRHAVRSCVSGCGDKVDELLQQLLEAGYAMHAVCLWAPLAATRRRGEPRSIREGKLWSPPDAHCRGVSGTGKLSHVV